MLETPHVIVGAAIAVKVANPALAIPLAFGSHFLFDKIPHWNPHLNTEKAKFGKVTTSSTIIVFVDVLASIFSGLFIATKVLPDVNHAFLVLLCGFSAVLPDVVEAPYFFLNSDGKLIKKWLNFQKSIQTDAPFIPGLLIQIITVILLLLWIK